MKSKFPIFTISLTDHSNPTKKLNDRQIIRGFLEGNEEEYRIIVGWIDEVIRTCLWNDGILPQEVVSDTSYKLLTNFRSDQFKYNSSLKTYVQRITRFTIIDAVRNRRRAVSLQQQQIDPPDDASDPLQIMETDEEQHLFDRIVDLLDEKCRKLWILIFDERKNYRQIAEQLRISEGAVKTRMFRCKEEAIAIRKRIT